MKKKKPLILTFICSDILYSWCRGERESLGVRSYTKVLTGKTEHCSIYSDKKEPIKA